MPCLSQAYTFAPKPSGNTSQKSGGYFDRKEMGCDSNGIRQCLPSRRYVITCVWHSESLCCFHRHIRARLHQRFTKTSSLNYKWKSKCSHENSWESLLKLLVLQWILVILVIVYVIIYIQPLDNHIIIKLMILCKLRDNSVHTER